MNSKSFLKWLIPAIFIVLGIVFYTAIHGHGFLGLICFGIAGVITAYFLIALLRGRCFAAAKALNLILTGVLCVGVLGFCVVVVVGGFGGGVGGVFFCGGGLGGVCIESNLLL